MASGSTAVRGLPYPLETDTPDVAADIESLANAVDTHPNATSGLLAALPTGGSVPPRGDFYYATDTDQVFQSSGSVWNQLIQPGQGFLNQRAMTSSATANAGDLVLASPSVTVTLPAPVLNTTVGVIANSSVTGATQVTVAYGSGSGHIYAMGALAVSSLKLGGAQDTLILQSDGTNWQVIAGLVDTGWVSLTLTSTINVANISLSSPQTAYNVTPAVRLRGTRALLRGGATTTTHAGATSWATIPSGFRPSTAWLASAQTVMLPTSGGNFTQVQISTAGVITDNTGQYVNSGQTIIFDGVTYEIS